ncbi:MAG: HAD-IB family hydrolase [Desulfobacterales bacterium]|nr:HAD-IB family hydrolase [Desulfobacterales bacterium]
MNLALFDFDGTITNCDTFTRFIYYSISLRRKLLGTVILSPFVLGYKLGFVSAPFLRPLISKVAYYGISESTLIPIGKKFAKDILPSVLRPRAIQQIIWHKNRGDKIVLVSASLSVYLSEWCNEYGIDLICSELETHKGVYTGNYSGKDCSGREKIKRVLNNYNLEEYSSVYAYGDTEEDKEMLKAAHHRFYRWKKDVSVE